MLAGIKRSASHDVDTKRRSSHDVEETKSPGLKRSSSHDEETGRSKEKDSRRISWPDEVASKLIANCQDYINGL